MRPLQAQPLVSFWALHLHRPRDVGGVVALHPAVSFTVYSPRSSASPHSVFGPRPWRPAGVASVLPCTAHPAAPGSSADATTIMVYHKAFWADPFLHRRRNRDHFTGREPLTLILQNVHRYMLFLQYWSEHRASTESDGSPTRCQSEQCRSGLACTPPLATNVLAWRIYVRLPFDAPRRGRWLCRSDPRAPPVCESPA